MIEVNLHPYGKKGRSKRGAGISLAPLLAALKGGKLPADPYIIFAVAAGLASVGLIGWMYLGLKSDLEEAEVRLAEELTENERFRDVIERNNALLARRDSIAERVAIIQEIDAGRYVGAHVMDEVAAALPEYTWLTEVIWEQDDPIQYRIRGRAANTFDITLFLSQLEASRFLRDVEYESINQGQSEVNPEEIEYTFTMLATYEPPPLDELETVPLFDIEAAQLSVPDSAGGS